MSQHIKTLLVAVVFSGSLSGFAQAGVVPTAASLLLHGQVASDAMSYSTKTPCPDPSATSAARPGAAKPHKIAARPHPKPKPKLQPAVAVHDGSEPATTPVKKVVHIKRKPKPKPSFAPLALAANKARMSPLPVASGQSLLSRPADPGTLCETVHRGDVGPTLVSNSGLPVEATPADLPALGAPGNAPASRGSEASAATPNAFSEPFSSGPVGIGGGGGGGPPGAIGSQAQNPPGSGGGTPPTETAPVSPIPEPSDWALMMFGLGAIGYGLRAQRRAGRKNQENVTA